MWGVPFCSIPCQWMVVDWPGKLFTTSTIILSPRHTCNRNSTCNAVSKTWPTHFHAILHTKGTPKHSVYLIPCSILLHKNLVMARSDTTFPVFCKNRNFHSSKNANKKLGPVQSKKFHFSLILFFLKITYDKMLPTTPSSPLCVCAFLSNFQHKTFVFLLYCIFVFCPKIFTDYHG